MERKGYGTTECWNHRNKVIISCAVNMILLLDTSTIRTGTQPLYIYTFVFLYLIHN